MNWIKILISVIKESARYEHIMNAIDGGRASEVGLCSKFDEVSRFGGGCLIDFPRELPDLPQLLSQLHGDFSTCIRARNAEKLTRVAIIPLDSAIINYLLFQWLLDVKIKFYLRFTTHLKLSIEK